MAPNILGHIYKREKERTKRVSDGKEVLQVKLRYDTMARAVASSANHSRLSLKRVNS
jgi:hypothetical protein